MHRRSFLLVASAAAAIACAPLAAEARPPSIVLVLTDDADAAIQGATPSLKDLAAGGATFTHAYYNDPLCGPSRATILTGQYAQNSKVTDNLHSMFVGAGDDKHTLAVQLKAAGYRTGLVGKYMNGYPSPKGAAYVPPGWDYWFAKTGSDSLYWGVNVDDNGRRISTPPTTYDTDLYADKAVAFVRDAAARGGPFFLEVTPDAPHVPADVQPRYAGLDPGLTLPKTPDFNEADVSDKPAYVRAKPLLGKGQIANIDAMYRKRVLTLLAVDDLIRRLRAALAASGHGEDTFIIAVSDNGWVAGQHRLRAKGYPYEEVVRMPLVVAGPGVPRGVSLDHLVGNADLAPTIAELAGADPPADADGRSFAPLLGTDPPPASAWRQAYPLSHADGSSANPPAWYGVRTPRYTYVRYATGERELYDDLADPWQLQSLDKAAPAPLLSDLDTLASTLAGCAGAACWAAEDRPTPEVRRPWRSGSRP